MVEGPYVPGMRAEEQIKGGVIGTRETIIPILAFVFKKTQCAEMGVGGYERPAEGGSSR